MLRGAGHQPGRAVRPASWTSRWRRWPGTAACPTGSRSSSTKRTETPPGRNRPPPGQGSPLAGPRRPAALDELWPELTPEQLLTDFYADPDALAHAGAQAGIDCTPLHRPAGAPWTVSDVPLLDEAAELLGKDDSAEKARRRAAEAQRAREELYAREVIQTVDQRALRAAVRVRPAGRGELAERHHDDGPPLTTAQRAARRPEWAYGHVIVDEAQELSEMAWRTVMRRVPTRSLTVVGDIAQTGSAAGARPGARCSTATSAGRWREERLHDQLPHPGRDHAGGRRRAEGRRAGPDAARARPRRRPAAHRGRDAGHGAAVAGPLGAGPHHRRRPRRHRRRVQGGPPRRHHLRRPPRRRPGLPPGRGRGRHPGARWTPRWSS